MKNPEHFTSPWHVRYPEVLRNNIEDAAQAWESFCKLDPDTQNLFAVTDLFEGSGFERKTGDGSAQSAHSHDMKLNFDVNYAGIDALLHTAALLEGPANEVAQTFIKSVQKLLTNAQSAISEVGAIIEARAGVEDFNELANASGPNAFFRFLYYPAGVEAGSIVGEPHPDHSGFTLHLKESTNGCEWLDPHTKTWHAMPVEKGYATAFAGIQTQLVTNGEIDALWHRIVANETTAKFGRIAIVCFVSLNEVPKYDRTRHGRLQQFEAGSTYKMNPVEFKDLFVS